MRLGTFVPGPALIPYVSSFVEVEADVETTRVLIPDGAITLGFRYRGSATSLPDDDAALAPCTAARVPDASLTGLRTRARRMQTSKGGGIVLARFREGAASAFFEQPMHDLFATTVSLDDVASGQEVARTVQEVVLAASSLERVHAVEQFLMRRLRPERRDRLVDRAVGAICASPHTVRVAALARQLHISRDRLEKRFRIRVGSSPKQLAFTLRLRRAVDAYPLGMSLGQLAQHAGFYDQSHFNRDFRLVTGQSPERFFRTGEHC